MSATHYGGECVNLKFPICGRAPNWVAMTTAWESVTCKFCLRKRPTEQPHRPAHQPDAVQK